MIIKYFKKVDTCVCPRCGIKQTIFLYHFNASGEKVPSPGAGDYYPEGIMSSVPAGITPGFICVKCNVPIMGEELFKVGGLTVSDIPAADPDTSKNSQ